MIVIIWLQLTVTPLTLLNTNLVSLAWHKLSHEKYYVYGIWVRKHDFSTPQLVWALFI